MSKLLEQGANCQQAIVQLYDKREIHVIRTYKPNLFFQVDLRYDMAFCRNGQLLERNGDGGSYLCTISKAPCPAGGRNGLFTWLQEPRRPHLNQHAKKASRVQVVFYFQLFTFVWIMRFLVLQFSATRVHHLHSGYIAQYLWHLSNFKAVIWLHWTPGARILAFSLLEF